MLPPPFYVIVRTGRMIRTHETLCGSLDTRALSLAVSSRLHEEGGDHHAHGRAPALVATGTPHMLLPTTVAAADVFCAQITDTVYRVD